VKSHPWIWGLGGVSTVYLLSSTNKEDKKASIVSEIRETPFTVQSYKTSLESIPNYPSYNTHENLFIDKLPISSPDGYPWLTHNIKTFASNLDSNGQWWINFGSAWGKVTPSSGGILESINNIVLHYVVPALEAMSIGFGPVGIAAGQALKAWSILAEGGTINDALLSAARSKLPSGIAEDAFQTALSKAKTLSIEELNKLKDKYVSASQKQAFDQGLVFAAGKAAQDSALESLKKSIPDKAEIMQTAMNSGAALADIAYAYGGNKGLQFIDNIFKSQKTLSGENY
jgi:hypothetical protein